MEELSKASAKRTSYEPTSNLEGQQPREENIQTVSQAVQDAIANELILETIFNNLPTRNLVQECRLVSSQWNRVATKILKNRPDAYVKVDWCRSVFEDISSCIDSSADFPFHEIDLECSFCDFTHSAQEWLQVGLFQRHSSLFRRLRIDARYIAGSFDRFVLGAFSHIESLTLNRIEFKAKNRRLPEKFFRDDEGNVLNFFKLKTITMGNGRACNDVDLTFLMGLLQACPNLERVKNCTSAHLPALSNAGKLGTVKSLRVCRLCANEGDVSTRPSTVETLIIDVAEFHNTNLYGSGFIIEFSVLQPLLEWNRQALHCIDVRARVYGGRNINDWPKLSSLKYLRLGEPIDFPNSVEEIFPALETVQLGAGRSGDFILKPYSVSELWKEPLRSVTKLEVLTPISHEDWKSLSSSIPNVHHVLLDSVCCKIGRLETKREDDWNNQSSCYPDVLDFWSGVSGFQELETLCISPIALPLTNLDEFFTGICGYTLTNLRAKPHLPLPTPLEFIDVLRGRQSIASLTGVKELVVRFTMSDSVTRNEVQKKQPMSHVTIKYGLKMVPVDIKIRFMYDHWCKNADLIQEALSPAAERVTFGHWNANLG